MKPLAKLLLLLLFSPSVWGQQPKASVTRITGYVEVDNDDAAPVISDFKDLNYLDVAFINPVGGTLPFTMADSALVDSARSHSLKVLATIGGKKYPSSLITLISADHRAQFAQQIKAYLVQHHFDGVDIDFEGKYLVNNDYEPFIRTLYAVLNIGEKKELTLAVGGDDFMPNGSNKFNIPQDFWNCVDFVNAMSYDEKSTRHPPHQDASRDYAKRDLARWINVMQVPLGKLGLGLPFYGQKFNTWKDEVAFSSIIKDSNGKEDDDSVKLDDGGSIYYNGRPTLIWKTNYACSIGIAGIMVWQVWEDIPGDNSLLKAINEAISSYGQKK